MAHLYCHLDESGKHADHPFVSFSGFVDGFETWRAFQLRWAHWLKHYELDEFHTVEALRYSQPYGNMKRGTAEDRIKDVLPFVREIALGLSLGIVTAVDVQAYGRAGAGFHKTFGRDPHYFAFARAVNEILIYPAIPKHYEVGLILDDDEAKAMECYRLLKKMKAQHEQVRKRVTSICFDSDRSSIPVQASDLFAYVVRLEAQKRFLGIDYVYRPLFEAFREVSPETGRHLHFAGYFYNAELLARYLDKATEQRRKRQSRDNV